MNTQSTTTIGPATTIITSMHIINDTNEKT